MEVRMRRFCYIVHYWEWDRGANGLIELLCLHTHPPGFTDRGEFGWCNLLLSQSYLSLHEVLMFALSIYGVVYQGIVYLSCTGLHSEAGY